ncbi:MAG TPA: GNAT family N-acetyltransferase [Gammaproteobacteria bacterium]|nr:GNAT family N-acetyltransferase [Gammaproteobacteria bacterium]HIL98377.1 GNAT family N-acetyltransferase [Pseudomonadales bacterium]
MLIRRLTSADLEDYRGIRLEALRVSPQAFGSDYEESKARSLKQLGHFIVDDIDHFMLGAFDDQQLTGIVSLRRLGGIKMRHKAEINQMYVTPGYRGKGVSRQLMTVLIRMAREVPELVGLKLSVVSTSVEASSLYKSLGFTRYGIEKRALKIGENYFDEALLELDLELDNLKRSYT